MTDETKSKLLKWIEDNKRDHGEDSYWGGDCPDQDSPYVDSIELQDFINSL